MANEGSIYRVENGMAVPYANLGGGAETEEIYRNISASVAVLNSLPFTVSAAYLHRKGRESIVDLALTSTGSYTFNGTVGIVEITDTDGKLMPFYLDAQHATNNLYCGRGMFTGLSGSRAVFAYIYLASSTTVDVIIVSDDTLTMSDHEYLNITLSFINKYSG